MMISKKMAKRLNDQVNHEFYANWVYQAMAYALQSMNLKGFADWFDQQAAEERSHAVKIADYLLDQGAPVTLKELPAPRTDYKSVQEICQAALAHELKVTKQINDIAALAETEKDRATIQFIGWFVTEQVEEVATATELLEMVKIAKSPDQLFMMQAHVKRPAATE
jgi:ferritin